METKGIKKAIKRLTSCLFAVVLILSGWMYLLSSCEREDEIPGSSRDGLISPTGKPVTVTFTVGEHDFGNNGIAVRNAQTFTQPTSFSFIPEQPLAIAAGQTHNIASENRGIYVMEGAYVPLSDSVCIAASIQESGPSVSIRAASPLEVGKKARIVAYDIVSYAPDARRIAYADYEVDGGGNLIPSGTSPLEIPSGSVLFVAYSFNDANPIDPFTNTDPLVNDIIPAIGSRDLLWGDTLVTLGPGNANVHLILDHKFSKITVEAESQLTSGSIINGIYGARYAHTFPSLNVYSGVLSTGVTGNIPVNWQTPFPGNPLLSNDHFIHTNGGPPTVEIDSVRIDGTSYTTGYIVNYITPLDIGTKYALHIYFVPPCTAVTGISITPSASSAIVGNPVTLTANGLTPFDATDVLYIWEVYTGAGWATIDTTTTNTCNVTILNVGSNRFRVTATNNCTITPPQATTDITGTPKIPSPTGGSAARITWEPPSATYTAGRYILTYDPRDAGLYFKYGSLVGVYSDINGQNQILPPQGMSPYPSLFDAAVDLPWNLTGVAGTGQAAWDNVPYTSTFDNLTASFHNAANVKAGRGDPCRLVGLDLDYILNTMTASETDRSKYDNATWRLPTGTENHDFSGHASNLVNTSDHWWAEAEPGNISYGVAGGEFPSKNHVNGGMLKFLPAAGDRSTDGNYINSAGLYGWYWGSTASLPTLGDLLHFSNTYIAAFSSTDKKLGLNVRCVYAKTEFSAYWYQAVTGGSPWSVTRLSDQTDDYIFPWNTTSTDIDVESNIGCTFDNASSVIAPGYVTPGVSFPSGDNTVYPYTFTFSNTNYTTTANYSLKFNSNPAGSGDVTRTLRRGIQEWSRSGSTSVSEGYHANSTPVSMPITDNIEWSFWFSNWMNQGAASSASTWTQASVGAAGGVTPTTVSETNGQVDDRVFAPVAHSGAYPATGVLTKNTAFQVNVSVATGPIILAPQNSALATRSAQLNFQNRSSGLALSPSVSISQYLPRAYVVGQTPPSGAPSLLVWPQFTSSAMVPQGGGTYTFTVSTNVTNLGIRVYGTTSTSSTAVSSIATSTTLASGANDAAGSNVTLSVSIPNAPVFRTLSFYFYSTDTPVSGAANEVKFAEVLQDGGLIGEIGPAEPRIYIQGSGDNARAMLTQSISNYGAYFQFGGILGWQPHGTAANAVYNPSVNASSVWSSTWQSVTTANTAVSHTNASLMDGKGDPCRLLGYTAAQIRESLLNGHVPDNKKYRLPTTTSYLNSVRAYDIGGDCGVYLNQVNLSVLVPKNGWRENNGTWYHTPGHWTAYVSFWFNTTYNNTTQGECILDTTNGNSASFIQDRYNQARGFGVRCVTQ